MNMRIHLAPLALFVLAVATMCITSPAVAATPTTGFTEDNHLATQSCQLTHRSHAVTTVSASIASFQSWIVVPWKHGEFQANKVHRNSSLARSVANVSAFVDSARATMSIAHGCRAGLQIAAQLGEIGRELEPLRKTTTATSDTYISAHISVATRIFASIRTEENNL